MYCRNVGELHCIIVQYGINNNGIDLMASSEQFCEQGQFGHPSPTADRKDSLDTLPRQHLGRAVWPPLPDSRSEGQFGHPLPDSRSEGQFGHPLPDSRSKGQFGHPLPDSRSYFAFIRDGYHELVQGTQFPRQLCLKSVQPKIEIKL
jgi:hypothetical protein